MTPAGSVTTNANIETAIAGLEAIMDRLEQTIAEETAQVRAGRLSKAFDLENAKIECARLYLVETERLKTAKGALAPAAFDRLRRRHDAFQAHAAHESYRAGNGARGVRRHHSRCVGGTCAQAGSIDL